MIIISTKTGDKGKTSLANGRRVSKIDPVFDVIGTLDELNSWLGLLVSKLDNKFLEEKKFLLEIQYQLFIMGAELAKAPKVTIKDYLATKIEKRVIKLQTKLEKNWHTKFVLPGGTELAALTDITRTVSRRFERVLLSYAQKERVSTPVIKAANRLSDYLYVLRCLINQKMGQKEELFEKKG